LEQYNRFSSVITEAEMCAKILKDDKEAGRTKEEIRKLYALLE